MKLILPVLTVLTAITFGLPAVAGAQQQTAAARQAQARAQAFDRADTNKDGVLSREEFERVMQLRQRALGRLRTRQLQMRLRRLDTNRDRVISREEFGGSSATFDRLDVNKNGVLEPPELRRGMFPALGPLGRGR